MNTKNVLSTYANSLPGTILKDFETFLNFIQKQPLPLTGKKGLLPNNCLPVLNDRMSHRLDLKLKREQQFCYPHINALYLLGRASGLVQITHDKSKRYLALDANTFNAWQEITDVDKYFNLMLIWLLRSDPHLIDPHVNPYLFDPLTSATSFIREKLEDTLTIKDIKEQKWALYRIKLYNLALCEMFGMLVVTDGESLDGEGWYVKQVLVTEFGKALTILFYENNLVHDALIDDEKSGQEKFYRLLKAYFPAWKTVWKPQTKITEKGLHVYKVSLSKDLWRKIGIQGTATMDELADAILDAFEFDDDHLYQFSYVDRFGVSQTISHPYVEDEETLASDVVIGSIDIQPNDTIHFLYDFGDRWEFEIKFEKIDTGMQVKQPTIIDRKGKSPEQYSTDF